MYISIYILSHCMWDSGDVGHGGSFIILIPVFHTFFLKLKFKKMQRVDVVSLSLFPGNFSTH